MRQLKVYKTLMTIWLHLSSWSTISKHVLSSQALAFERHLVALHKVHVQIDYRARLAYHTPPSWWLLTVLFFLPFCCAYHRMNYFLQKVVLHDPWWLSKVNICPLSPADMFPGGNADVCMSWHRHIYISSYTQMTQHTHTQTRINMSTACHGRYIFSKNYYSKLGADIPSFCGLETDPCNLNDFRRAFCSTC